MYKRDIEDYLTTHGPKYPVVTIIGPRQSGKSTLARHLYSTYEYRSLETPETREEAIYDPRAFLRRAGSHVILDEIQRAPELLSYIQGIVDEPGNAAHYILTGSHQLSLMEQVTQSLAGRTIIATLLPLSWAELTQNTDTNTHRLEEVIFAGGYPRIHDRQLDPQQWLAQYVRTYVERDVRLVKNISNFDQFERFLRLCAGRVGQLVNFANLGNDVGMSGPTIREWTSLLRVSFISDTLVPHHRNFRKRLVKSPKLYFYDTGLLCYLLQIQTPQQLETHPLRGAIFENWVVAELWKEYFNHGKEPPLYFWRDTAGHEVDVIIDRGHTLYPIEIKSSETAHASLLEGLTYFNKIQNTPGGTCIYAGNTERTINNMRFLPWNRVHTALE